MIQQAKRVFRGTPLYVGWYCSIDKFPCRTCSEECNMRVAGVFSKLRSRLIGYFVGGHLVKTNPKPSKRYLKRILGIREEKRQRFRKFYGGRLNEKRSSKTVGEGIKGGSERKS